MRGTFLAALTLARVPCGFITWETLALPHWNHPIPLSAAVDAWGGLTDGVLHTNAFHFPQRVRHRLREDRQALHGGRAGLVVDADRQQRHAGTHVLKGQVEAFLGQRAHVLCLGVDLQDVPLGDLIRRDGGHFPELALAEVGADVGVSFGEEEVEGFLAGDRAAAKGVAVPHHKLQLHRDAAGPGAPLDEGGAQPVILVTRVYVTDAVGV